jgi:hypothetical protein
MHQVDELFAVRTALQSLFQKTPVSSCCHVVAAAVCKLTIIARKRPETCGCGLSIADNTEKAN